MNKLISYVFAFNLILFCFVACETKDDSSGFYSGDSLATKKSEGYNESTNIEEKEKNNDFQILIEIVTQNKSQKDYAREKNTYYKNNNLDIKYENL